MFFWAGDTITVSGSESVLINFSKISIDHPSSTISTRMATVWYGAKQSGNIDIEIKHTQVVL
jgi:hypothetical protein